MERGDDMQYYRGGIGHRDGDDALNDHEEEDEGEEEQE